MKIKIRIKKGKVLELKEQIPKLMIYPEKLTLELLDDFFNSVKQINDIR